MVRSKRSLPILAILVLAMLSNGEPFGHVAKAQTATSALAAQIRSQGFACDEPQKATRDVKLSKPDYDVWVLTCKNATYRIGRYPDLPAKVEKSEIRSCRIPPVSSNHAFRRRYPDCRLVRSGFMKSSTTIG